jgi:hypothetical protein
MTSYPKESKMCLYCSEEMGFREFMPKRNRMARCSVSSI